MSPLSQNHLKDYNNFLKETWIEDMKTNKLAFREPILDAFISDKVKLFCESLNQDSHVFHMSLTVLEDFIASQNLQGHHRTSDPLLIILATVYLSGKHMGDLCDYKTGQLITLYNKLSGQKATNQLLKETEVIIFQTILKHSKMPLCTQVDDLKTLISVHIVPSELKEVFMELSVEFLDFYALHRHELFLNLKIMYNHDSRAMETFRENYRNRFYVPCAVILCSLSVSDVLSEVNIEKLLVALCEGSQLHLEDLTLLAKSIHTLYICNCNKKDRKIIK